VFLSPSSEFPSRSFFYDGAVQNYVAVGVRGGVSKGEKCDYLRLSTSIHGRPVVFFRVALLVAFGPLGVVRSSFDCACRRLCLLRCGAPPPVRSSVHLPDAVLVFGFPSTPIFRTAQALRSFLVFSFFTTHGKSSPSSTAFKLYPKQIWQTFHLRPSG